MNSLFLPGWFQNCKCSQNCVCITVECPLYTEYFSSDTIYEVENEDDEDNPIIAEAREFRGTAFARYNAKSLAKLIDNEDAQCQFMSTLAKLLIMALDSEWHYDLTKRKFEDCDKKAIDPSLQFDKMPRGINQFKEWVASLNPRPERLQIRYRKDSDSEYKEVTTFGE